MTVLDTPVVAELFNHTTGSENIFPYIEIFSLCKKKNA
jgi:hypothetical protein